MKNVKTLLLTILGSLFIQFSNAQCAYFNYIISGSSVQFYDSSNCQNQIYSATQWNFGDGNYATGANPSHTYSSGGTYTVIMYAVDTNRWILDSAIKTVTINATGGGGCAKFYTQASYLNVTFTEISSCQNANIYDWDFGDGSYGSGSTAYHTYSTAGTYTVTLAVLNSTTLLDTVSMQVTVSAAPPSVCRALFSKAQAIDSSGNPIAGHVNIFDQSTANNPTYLWSFGDGNTSTSKNPSHTYTGNGPYALCLTITDSNCTDTYCDTIRVDSNGNVKSREGFSIHVGGYVAPPVGIDQEELTSYKVFPNPASDVVNIQTPQNADLDIRLINIQGQVLMNQNNIQSNGLYELNISDLKTGLYLLQVSVDGAELSTSRILVQ